LIFRWGRRLVGEPFSGTNPALSVKSGKSFDMFTTNGGRYFSVRGGALVVYPIMWSKGFKIS